VRFLSLAYGAVSAGLVALAVALAPDGRVASLPWIAASALAAIAIGYGVRRHRPRRRVVWLSIAAALGAWGAAAALFPLLTLPATTEGAHVADLLYLPGYAGMAVATAVLVRQIGPLRTAGLEAAIGTLTLSSFLWSLVIEPNLAHHRDVFGVAETLFPLCDLVLLMLVLRLLFSPSSRLAATRLLGAAATVLVVSDVAYFSPVLDKGVGAGRLIDAGYVVAYVFFGAAALHPSMRRLPLQAAEEVSSRRLVVLLGCAPLLIPLAAVFNQIVTGESESFDLAALGIVVIALVMMRLAGLLRQSDELRRRAEESEQKLRMVFDSAGIGISIGKDGMMSETNDALHRMLGYTSDELETMHFEAITHADDRAVGDAATEAVMSGAERSRTFEKRFVRKDGGSVWTEVTLTRAPDASFGIALIEDVTARKELEEGLRQAQKMEAVGKLAGGIAHDFNNLMTAVTGCADLLQNEIAVDDPRRARVDVIAESAARAADLTRQLLAFSRRQVLRPEALDLVDVVNRMRPILERLLPPNIDVSYDLARGAVARIDGPQFEQVLLNLALNARDAMPDGGRLSIEVRRVGPAVQLRVGDNGTGMGAETKERIFDPFFTTKQSGTGLGLSTVDGIVGQSGGAIAVHSRVGTGTVFTITLPAADEPARAPRPVVEHPPLTAATAARSGRVLLADDEDLVRRVTAEMLRRAGYEVVEASTGEEALELSVDSEIDVLVTDVAMAGMDGATLARRARDLRPTLPVLFISGYPAEVLTGQRMVEEGDDVLTKPFTPGQLSERIERVRREARELAAA
jgi:PAS domain S-box-containing protein